MDTRRPHTSDILASQLYVGAQQIKVAESEIKAVNHTLKSEVISNRGILNAIGLKQGPTIEEDNQACVYASEAKHMTRNLRHLDLA